MSNSKKGTKIMTREKIMLFLIGTMFFILLLVNLIGQAALTKINFEVEMLKEDVVKQEQVNEVLTMKRDELSSYARIDAAAKEAGLTYNNNNIKIVN